MFLIKNIYYIIMVNIALRLSIINFRVLQYYLLISFIIMLGFEIEKKYRSIDFYCVN